MLLKLLYFLIPLTDFCKAEDNNNNSFTNNTNIYTSNNFTILSTLSPLISSNNISTIIIKSEKSNINESTSIILGISIPIVFIIFSIIIYFLYKSYSETVYVETNEFMKNPMYDTDSDSIEDLEDTYLELSPGEEDIYDEIYQDDSISSDDNM